MCSPQTSAGWGTRAPHAGGGLCYVNHPWAVLANGSNFGNSHSTDEWRQCKQSADHPCVLHRHFGDSTLTSVTAVSPEWLERIYGRAGNRPGARLIADRFSAAGLRGQQEISRKDKAAAACAVLGSCVGCCQSALWNPSSWFYRRFLYSEKVQKHKWVC